MSAWMVTLPKIHPLQPLFHTRARQYIKSHRSPLHELAHIYDMEPEIIEKIWLVNIALCYSGKFTTRVAMMAEEAEEQEVASGAGIQIYMDGSGVEGQVGAVAVLTHPCKSV